MAPACFQLQTVLVEMAVKAQHEDEGSQLWMLVCSFCLPVMWWSLQQSKPCSLEVQRQAVCLPRGVPGELAVLGQLGAGEVGALDPSCVLRGCCGLLAVFTAQAMFLACHPHDIMRTLRCSHVCVLFHHHTRTRPKPRASRLIQVSHTGEGPSAWTLFHCFPRCT